jgi:alpha,alpha-trehalase
MSEPRLDLISGLSRYRPDGEGIPPETEASHFTHILMPYAEKNGISVLEFCEKYNDGSIKEPELDEYFLHDRAVRESGHDTTYRFEKVCANLGTIDLNSLLYKYEVDIGTAIRDHLGGELELDEEFDLSVFPFGEEIEWDEDFDTSFPVNKIISHKNFVSSSTGKISSLSSLQTPEEWFARAERRKVLIDKYCWHEGKGMYFDYDTVQKKQCLYESATTFWPMWAGCCSEVQARKNVMVGLGKLEVLGGLVSGTEASRGAVGLDRPNRQWE